MDNKDHIYETIFNNSPDGIAVADIETKKFIFVNPAMGSMLGYNEEELIGKSIESIHPKEFLPKVLEEFQAQARGEKVLAENLPCIKKDKTVIYADITTVPVELDRRKCNIGFFRDVTERMKAIDEAEKRTHDLEVFQKASFGREERIVELKKRVEDLEEKLRAKG